MAHHHRGHAPKSHCFGVLFGFLGLYVSAGHLLDVVATRKRCWFVAARASVAPHSQMPRLRPVANAGQHRPPPGFSPQRNDETGTSASIVNYPGIAAVRLGNVFD